MRFERTIALSQGYALRADVSCSASEWTCWKAGIAKYGMLKELTAEADQAVAGLRFSSWGAAVV